MPAADAAARRRAGGVRGAPSADRFALLSGLAQGADRLAAKAALERGWRLQTALPFFAPALHPGFPEPAALAEFFPADAPPCARHAFIADHYTDAADALIAICDGEGAQGHRWHGGCDGGGGARRGDPFV